MATIHGRTILYASAVSSLSTKDVGRKHERILRCHDEDPQGIHTCSHTLQVRRQRRCQRLHTTCSFHTGGDSGKGGTGRCASQPDL